MHQPRALCRQPQEADVALIAYEQVDWATATSIIKRSRVGMTSRPFHEGLHGGDLEDAARVTGPFMQSAGPAEPVSLKI
jgi:hypothetical protein